MRQAKWPAMSSGAVAVLLQIIVYLTLELPHFMLMKPIRTVSNIIIGYDVVMTMLRLNYSQSITSWLSLRIFQDSDKNPTNS